MSGRGERRVVLVSSNLPASSYRVHSSIAELKEIPPGGAIVVALYFIFMQKHRNNFQARRARLANSSIESGETCARVRSSTRGYIFSWFYRPSWRSCLREDYAQRSRSPRYIAAALCAGDETIKEQREGVFRCLVERAELTRHDAT